MSVKGVCFFDCWDACAVIFENKDKLIAKPDSSNPYVRGFLCQRFSRFLRERQSERRISYPMIKKDGEFKRISWDEALDLLSNKLKELKREGKEWKVVLGVNTGNAGIVMRLSSLRFFSLYGEITLMDGNLCDDAGNFAHELDFGKCFNHPPEQIAESKVAIIWGRNPARTNIHFIPLIELAREKGTFVYLIDPVKTETANFVDKYIQVKPGSDIYLALAIAKAILENGWEDKKFISERSSNFEDFKRILNNWTIEDLSRMCDVNPEDISEIARKISFEKPASIWLGMGAQHYSHGVSTFRAIDAISALSGNLGLRGGGVSFSHYSVTSFDISWAYPKNRFKLIPKARIASEFEKELPEVLWIQSFNLFNQTQNTKELKEIAERIPLKVVIDFRWNETTKLADLILPCATYLEKEDIRGSFWSPIIGYLPKIFEPLGEALPEWEIYKKLAEALGFGDEFGKLEDIMELTFSKLKPTGISLSLLKERGWIKSPLFPEVPFEDGKFLTEDGKFHFLRELKLPKVRKLKEGQFFLITPKSIARNNSQRPIDFEEKPPICLINPIWRERYPSEEGYILSEKGKIKVRLRFDPRVRPDTLVVDQGCSGINDLSPEGLAEDGRGATFFETIVSISEG